MQVEGSHAKSVYVNEESIDYQMVELLSYWSHLLYVSMTEK